MDSANSSTQASQSHSPPRWRAECRDLERLERQLCEDATLTDLILSRADSFPPAPPDPEQVNIRTDAVSVNAALRRALALTLEGSRVTLKLETK